WTIPRNSAPGLFGSPSGGELDPKPVFSPRGPDAAKPVPIREQRQGRRRSASPSRHRRHPRPGAAAALPLRPDAAAPPPPYCAAAPLGHLDLRWRLHHGRLLIHHDSIFLLDAAVVSCAPRIA
ncbi:unnamed protein product, partial [Urochloa humidicola]